VCYCVIADSKQRKQDLLHNKATMGSSLCDTKRAQQGSQAAALKVLTPTFSTSFQK
jgi:hypothetical protein